MKITRTILLIFILFFFFNSRMKSQTFNCFITNDTLLSPTEYQFDIYLEATSTDFYFRSIQSGIQFDSTFIPAGATITASPVAGSTQLNSYTTGTLQFNSFHSCLSIPMNIVTSCLGSPASNIVHF